MQMCAGLEEGDDQTWKEVSQVTNTGFYEDKMEALTSHRFFLALQCCGTR